MHARRPGPVRSDVVTCAARVEAVVHPRASRRDLVRVWLGAELVASSCRVCGVVTDADKLVTNWPSVGGRALLCRCCQGVAALVRVRSRRIGAAD